MKRHYWIATALYCGLIFFLSSRSDLPDTGNVLPFGDKIAHFIAYGGLAAIVSVGIRRSNPAAPPMVQWWAPVLFAIAYGMSDEIHQLFVPHRSFDLWDLAADAAGAMAVQIVLCGWRWGVPLRHETLS